LVYGNNYDHNEIEWRVGKKNDAHVKSITPTDQTTSRDRARLRAVSRNGPVSAPSANVGAFQFIQRCQEYDQPFVMGIPTAYASLGEGVPKQASSYPGHSSSHGFRHGYQSASIVTSHRRNGGNLLKTYRTHRNISLLIVIRPHAWKGDFGSEDWGFNSLRAHHSIL
jgi:hypothetical protein